jgi:hypothetical protein
MGPRASTRDVMDTQDPSGGPSTSRHGWVARSNARLQGDLLLWDNPAAMPPVREYQRID